MGTVRNVPLDLPPGPAIHAGLASEMSELPLWYNSLLPKTVVPEALRPYIKGRRYLSTKQVPSCLILRCAGSQSVGKNRDNLLRGGFTIQEMDKDTRETRDLTVRRLIGDDPITAGTLAEVLTTSAEIADMQAIDDGAFLDSDFESSGSETENIPAVLEETARNGIRYRANARYRVKYDDPWKIHAGYRLGESLGEVPEITLWSGDGIRLQDPLPARLLGPNWEGSPKSKVRFSAIVAHDVKLHVVYKHTHWGQRLHELCNEPGGRYLSWARTLRTRINRFLNGSTDPCMSKSQIETFFEGHSPNRKARSERFIEMLKTVDGIFLQRYLCYPEEVWTWQRFDMFTLGNISYLIGDEFLDGVMTDKAISVSTAYSQLKASRKWFKEALHRGSLDSSPSGMDSIPKWCRQFANVWKRANCSTGPRRVYLIGILSQTRGCGTPPPLVILQSKVKFLRTIGRERPPEPASAGLLRRAALREILKELPDSAFTGLATKSRVTVSTSSSWEKTRREGGTIEAAREILASLPIGEQVPVRNLDTGRIESYKNIGDFDSTGEAVFWLALDHTLRTPPDLLKQAFLTMVKEPGKARSVTKARACLKIVLDLVNKIVSSPLEKGIRSSTSGMGKANHGWNLFCRLMSDEVRDMVFSLDTREENAYEGYVERTDTFKDLFMSSTDYEEATDQLSHEVARDLGEAWMTKCGIPRLLRALVSKTCFQPREVFFHASGVLRSLGTARPEYGPDIRSVRLVCGVLMGDPLTKVVLHLVNVVTRRVGSRLFDADFYDNFVNASQAYEKFRLGYDKCLTGK
uniref:RNA-dependent RNA polymerase n=1 Tax=Downy mildew lesion associated splipalmivirus 4 TaxID=2719525 RepID=A0A6G9RTF3_9VIRU|nr:RNA-dependent RNA polymerase [Plasmopara viticola lesion associated narnavirus 4]